tara:strand:- start:13675 stop:14580 length:906 start_codon:yes stop_codon:yes gene_type:complete
MGQKPQDISILMMLYNHGEWISETLDALLAQTYQDFNLLIVDDVSSDKSLEIAKRYQSKFKNCHIIENKKNKGVIENYFCSLQEIERLFPDSGFFMWASPDDTWSPEYLEKTRQALLDNPQAIVSQTGYEMVFVESSHKTEHVLSTINPQTYADAKKVFLSHGPAHAKTHYNGMIQGLIRFSEMRTIFPNDRKLLSAVLCIEISMLVAMLLQGAMIAIPDVLYHRKKLGKFSDKYPNDEFSVGRASLLFRLKAVCLCLPWLLRINKNKALEKYIPLLWIRLWYHYVFLFVRQKIKALVTKR